MSNIYDNWERLAAAVVRREQFRQLCNSESIKTTDSDLSGRFSLDISGYDPTEEVASISFAKFLYSNPPQLLSANPYLSHGYQSSRWIQTDPAGARYNGETLDEHDVDGSGSLKLRPPNSNVTEDHVGPFMGVKVRRKASSYRDYIGDSNDVQSRPYLMKILQKQGDRKVLFADKVVKLSGSGKMKKRVLLITDFAIYIMDPDTDALKRRTVLAAVEKLCLSELSDNFFAIIIPTEYDLLIASTRKTQIVTVLLDATKSASDYELEVSVSNRFEYNAAAEVVKEVQFEEVEGGVRTRIMRK